ncbi:MAG: hypothetical protein RLZZ337_1209 [Bacteroidota bacterium]
MWTTFTNTNKIQVAKSIHLYVLIGLLMLGFSSHNPLVLRSNTANIELRCNTKYGTIKGTNHKVKSAFERISGKMQFSVLLNDIYFEKAIVQDEFNTTLIESSKYPLATFDGFVQKSKLIDFAKEGTYSSTITGDLKIKGITRKVSTSGSFIVTKDNVRGVAHFEAKPEDFGISIPSYAKNKIDEKIQIRVTTTYNLP